MDKFLRIISRVLEVLAIFAIGTKIYQCIFDTNSELCNRIFIYGVILFIIIGIPSYFLKKKNSRSNFKKILKLYYELELDCEVYNLVKGITSIDKYQKQRRKNILKKALNIYYKISRSQFNDTFDRKEERQLSKIEQIVEKIIYQCRRA